MNIVEIAATVSKNGTLIMPKNILSDMGLHPEDEVKIAYITRDDDLLHNTYKEFLITPGGIASINNGSNVGKIYIPDEILEAAEIDQNSDVVISCATGEIRITAVDISSTEDNPATEIRQLAGDIKSINTELECMEKRSNA